MREGGGLLLLISMQFFFFFVKDKKKKREYVPLFPTIEKGKREKEKALHAYNYQRDLISHFSLIFLMDWDLVSIKN